MIAFYVQEKIGVINVKWDINPKVVFVYQYVMNLAQNV
jgi:hypothetical protein